VLGKSILFGEEALENRLSLEIYRPLERGVIKEGSERSAAAVKELIRHLIETAKGDNGYTQTRAIVGVPAESFKVNKLAIINLVADFADTIMVVSEPFSVAYGLNALTNAMVIDIGAGTMDFCIMRGTMPAEEDQRTILTAGDHIDDHLQTILRERHPSADFTLNMVRRFKEQYSFVGEAPEPVIVELPVAGKPTAHDITQEMRRACESILPGMVETTLELIAGFDPEFQKKVRNNIILAGGGSQIRGLRAHLEGVLKEYGPCNVQVANDPLFGGADGALAMAVDMPDEYWEKR
ncbi:MAG: rod shape-determining protein, partial [Desulfatitalea sp.]|nr:rod shape-determining protein [Desulfatitalea sp.]